MAVHWSVVPLSPVFRSLIFLSRGFRPPSIAEKDRDVAERLITGAEVVLADDGPRRPRTATADPRTNALRLFDIAFLPISRRVGDRASYPIGSSLCQADSAAVQ